MRINQFKTSIRLVEATLTEVKFFSVNSMFWEGRVPDLSVRLPVYLIPMEFFHAAKLAGSF